MSKTTALLIVGSIFLSLFTAHADDLALRERSFTGLDENSEYTGVAKSTSILRRQWINKHGPSEVLAPYPAELEARREAILDAIWNEDEEAFNELVKSPITGEGELQNQKFSKIARDLRKMDRWPLRSMRCHPVTAKNPEIMASVWSFHQLMTLPATNKTPRRGNINLIFRPEDWSLAFVRVNWFDNDNVNLLPRPESLLENDPVVDRKAPAEESD